MRSIARAYIIFMSALALCGCGGGARETMVSGRVFLYRPGQEIQLVPYPNAKFTVLNQPGPGQGDPVPIETVTADKDGFFGLRLGAGRYNVQGDGVDPAAGTKLYIVDGFDVPAPAPVELDFKAVGGLPL